MVGLAVPDEEEAGSARLAAVALDARRSGLALGTVEAVASGGAVLAGKAVLSRESRRSRQPVFPARSRRPGEANIAVSSGPSGSSLFTPLARRTRLFFSRVSFITRSAGKSGLSFGSGSPRNTVQASFSFRSRQSISTGEARQSPFSRSALQPRQTIFSRQTGEAVVSLRSDGSGSARGAIQTGRARCTRIAI